MTDPLDTFRQEAAEHLMDLEEALLEMEEHPGDEEPVGKAFRAMHTLKGAGGMFGYHALSDFTHHLETAFDKVRNGQYPVSQELISVVLDSKDHIEELLAYPEQTATQSITGQRLLAALHNVIPEDTSDGESFEDVPEMASEVVLSREEETWRLSINPASDAFADGFDILPIVRELHALGQCQCTAIPSDLPAIDDLDAEKCHLRWEVLLTTARTFDDIKDAFIFVEDEWDIAYEKLSIDADEAPPRLGDILVERGDVNKVDVEALLADRARTGEILQRSGAVAEDRVAAALSEQQFIRQARASRKRKQQQELDATVRVPAEKLNTLMDLVGELVIVQARLNQLAEEKQDDETLAIAEELDRLAMNLRDNTFDIRMLPIGTTFSRFGRLVRDLSKDLGKKIKLITAGGETELDKMVIDRLADPMVHLIRNSIDHGIETPDAREARGKDPIGTVTLRARQAESHVFVEIADDGTGLDAEKIFAKAVDRGLVAPDATLSPEECFNLIFEPGFSTAEQVTDVSGRGVGMDVVKRSIEALRGTVTVSSKPGAGSTVTIKLPMTLAIIEGLLVGISDERYVIPLNLVEECIELRETDRRSVERSDDNPGATTLMKLRGEPVPYASLRQWFQVSGPAPEIEQIVIVRNSSGFFGLCVDEVIGQHQTVVKSLGQLYQDQSGLAGATIMGDGRVAMILDVNQLVDAVQESHLNGAY